MLCDMKSDSCAPRKNRSGSAVKKLQIVLLSTVAACIYGCIHDEITVRLCLEYFTVAHPPLFHTTTPTLLALCWGSRSHGRYWGCARLCRGFGFASGGCTKVARFPPRPFHLFLLAAMGASACFAGIVGYQLSLRGFISIPKDLALALPAFLHDRFMAVWFAHLASYLVGLGGGAFLCFSVWRARGRPSVISFFPNTRLALGRTALLAAATLYVIWMRFGAS